MHCIWCECTITLTYTEHWAISPSSLTVHILHGKMPFRIMCLFIFSWLGQRLQLADSSNIQRFQLQILPLLSLRYIFIIYKCVLRLRFRLLCSGDHVLLAGCDLRLTAAAAGFSTAFHPREELSDFAFCCKGENLFQFNGAALCHWLMGIVAVHRRKQP